jgi:hypothetical protein
LCKNLIHAITRDPEKQEKANKAIKQAYLDYCGNVEYQLLRAKIRVDEIGKHNPLLSSEISSYITHAEIQLDQIH